MTKFDPVRFNVVVKILKFNKTKQIITQDIKELSNSLDQNFFKHLYLGILRYNDLLEHLITSLLTQRLSKLPKAVRAILQLGAFQFLFSNKTPQHAIVFECVALAKPFKVVYHKKLINGVLRSFQKQLPEIKSKIKTFQEHLKHSHPKWMAERWLKFYGPIKLKQILIANNLEKPVHLRSAKNQDLSELQTLIEQKGFSVKIHPIANVLILENTENFFKSNLLEDLSLYIQDPSVVLFEFLIAEHLSGTVLDLCAAPGGKTLMLDNKPEIKQLVLNDVSLNRQKLTLENATRLKTKKSHLVVSDGLSNVFDQQFDRVWLDVPCSSSGTISNNIDVKYVADEKTMLSKSKLQNELIASAYSLVKQNGILIYSTCSIELEENSQKVQNFLRNNKNSQLIELHKLKNFLPRYKNLINEEGCFNTLPSNDFKGFFGCLIKKC